MNTPLHLRLLSWLAKTLGALVLLVATLWTGAYFALGSGPGRNALAAMVRAEAPGLEPTVLRWGPAPDRLLLGGVEVRDLDRPLAALTMASVDLGLWSLLGGEPTIERLRVELSYLHANIGPDGRVDLLMVLAPKRSAATGAQKRPKSKPAFRIESLEVSVGELLVTSGADGVHARDVALSGAIKLGERLEVDLHAHTGLFHSTTDRGRRSWMASSLALETLTFSAPASPTHEGDQNDPARALADLDLAISLRAMRDDTRVWRLEARKEPGASAAIRLDADLGADDTAAFFPGARLPYGLEVAGLVFELVETPSLQKGAEGQGVGAQATQAAQAFSVRGHLEHLFVPELVTGELAVFDLGLSLAHFEIDPQRLIPHVEVTLDYLQASRVAHTHLPQDQDTATPAWTLEGLDFSGGKVSLLKRLELLLWPGHVQAITIGDTEPFAAELALDADLGLTGGPVNAHLSGPTGELSVRGKFRLSPLTGKAGFGAEVIFADLVGSPARTLLFELPTDHPLASAGAPAAAGTLTLELENGDDGPVVVFDEGFVSWSGGRWRWDGYAWSDDVAPPPEESP